jgi:hypothetical protein
LRRELSTLCDLAASSDASIIEDVPTEVQKVIRHLVWRWWKYHGLAKALCRLEGGGQRGDGKLCQHLGLCAFCFTMLNYYCVISVGGS